MKSYAITCAPTAVDADGVCASQSPGSGAISINGALASGGVATFGAAQLVRLTSGGNDSGITFTFTGTDANGRPLTETVAGTNGSNTDTTKHFKTITAITHTGSVATTVIVGNLIESVSPSIELMREKVNNFQLGIGCDLSAGTATYEIQQTYDGLTWFAHASITGKSADADGSLLFPVAALRLRLTASSSGSVTATVIGH